MKREKCSWEGEKAAVGGERGRRGGQVGGRETGSKVEGDRRRGGGEPEGGKRRKDYGCDKICVGR